MRETIGIILITGFVFILLIYILHLALKEQKQNQKKSKEELDKTVKVLHQSQNWKHSRLKNSDKQKQSQTPMLKQGLGSIST